MEEAKSYLMARDYTPGDSFSFGTVVSLLEEYAGLKCLDLQARVNTLCILRDVHEHQYKELAKDYIELKKCKEIKASVSVDESGMVELTVEADAYCYEKQRLQKKVEELTEDNKKLSLVLKTLSNNEVNNETN